MREVIVKCNPKKGGTATYLIPSVEDYIAIQNETRQEDPETGKVTYLPIPFVKVK